MSLHLKMSVNRASTEHQQSVNNLGCCILYNPSAVLWHLSIINVMAAIMSKRDCDMVTSLVSNWASTDRQQFWELHLVESKGCATEFTRNRRIGSLYRQYHMCQYCYTSKLSRCWRYEGTLGIMVEIWRRCGRNGVTEKRRRWEIGRKRQDGGGII